MDVQNLYQNIGFGNRIGFGERPALVLVDFIKGCTDPTLPLGFEQSNEIEQTNRLRELFYQKGLPVIYSTVVYNNPEIEAKWFLKKVPNLKRNVRNSVFTEFDERILPRPGDLVVEKNFASIFSGTNLASIISSLKVDTVILTGNSTSGCIRASCVDGMSHGFRTMVVRECVADRDETIHQVSLFDMDSKYGDVVGIEEVFKFYQ
ncbi:Maleamate amidohydrolase [Ureibacillus acetophenoni]